MTQLRRDLGQFFTPPEVASSLVTMIDATPRTVLDLGCGQGALSLAALARWGDTFSLTTIDIDPNSGPRGKPWATDHRHYQCDLLQTGRFTEVMGREFFDLALLNPPYGRRPLAEISQVRDAELCSSWEATRCRATLFFLRALEAVRVGGVVSAIIPETLAIGMSSRASRRAISNLGVVERVIALPAGTFTGTEARTVMVVVRRVSEREGDPAPWCHRSSAASELGSSRQFQSTIGELGVKVVRGRLSTAEARNVGAFHLDGFKSARDGVVSLPGQDHCDDDRAAQIGDILVARIGRNIAEKVVLVAAGSNSISDCVYRLRCSPKVVERVWNGLRSVSGRRQMEASLSGVTTRLLPLESLLTLRV